MICLIGMLRATLAYSTYIFKTPGAAPSPVMSHMCALPSPPPLKRRISKALRCRAVMPLACARHSALGCAGRAPVRVSGNTRMLPSKAAAQVAVRGPPQLCSDTTCTQDSAHVCLQKLPTTKIRNDKKET